MKTATVRLLDLWKAKQGIESDYAAAATLGITRGSPSNWRHGRSHAAPAMVKRMADDIGEEPGAWLALVESERAGTADDRKAWASVARRFGAAAALALCAVVAPVSSRISEVYAAPHYEAMHLTYLIGILLMAGVALAAARWPALAQDGTE